MTSYFVTGTDTDIGKTLVAAALLHALARRHPRVVGMKPVAAGHVRVGESWASEDALALRAASTVQVSPELDNPILLPCPLSPHIAAERAGVRIDIAELVRRYHALALRADAVVVEGAGGFHVPLSDTETGADLAQALALPVVLVVGLRLGCLNHAMLTAEAIRARGLTLAGWVANRIDPAMQAQQDNIAWLQRRLDAPLLAAIAHQSAPNPRAIAIHLPRSMTTTPSWIDEFPARIAELDRAHLRRKRRVVVPEGGARLQVDGQSMLAFCSNDYLGLAGHPVLVEAACAGASAFGVGSGASPLVSGHSAANAALEEELARFTQLPRALYFYAGYATNIGIVPALVGEGDALFSDALNHACLIDGARLSRAHIHRYAHGDLAALEAALAQSPARRKLVISDAVFSMDGDIADIPALLALCERHDALLLLDDAHGFGVLGPQGRGSLAHCGLTGPNASRRVLYMATLGKAAGVAGAFVAGDDALVEWLLQKTRSYIFATAAPPLLASALRASLTLMEAGQWRRDHLNRLVARLREGLAAALHGTSWTLGKSRTAIQALVIGPNDEALAVMEGLCERGLWVPAIRPPTVPEGTARLRIALSASHSEADVDRLVQTLAELASGTLRVALSPHTSWPDANPEAPGES